MKSSMKLMMLNIKFIYFYLKELVLKNKNKQKIYRLQNSETALWAGQKFKSWFLVLHIISMTQQKIIGQKINARKNRVFI